MADEKFFDSRFHSSNLAKLEVNLAIEWYKMIKCKWAKVKIPKSYQKVIKISLNLPKI